MFVLLQTPEMQGAQRREVSIVLQRSALLLKQHCVVRTNNTVLFFRKETG